MLSTRLQENAAAFPASAFDEAGRKLLRLQENCCRIRKRLFSQQSSRIHPYLLAAAAAVSTGRRRIFTIDPPEARDLDDAVHVQPVPRAVWTGAAAEIEVGVHIADVSFFVEKGGALDTAAQARAFSLYFSHARLPMLPPALAGDACSFLPGTPRLALSFLFRLYTDGAVVENWQPLCFRSVIQSCCRLTYEEADAVIDRIDGSDSPKGSPPVFGVSMTSSPSLFSSAAAAAAAAAEKKVVAPHGKRQTPQQHPQDARQQRRQQEEEQQQLRPTLAACGCIVLVHATAPPPLPSSKTRVCGAAGDSAAASAAVPSYTTAKRECTRCGLCTNCCVCPPTCSETRGSSAAEAAAAARTAPATVGTATAAPEMTTAEAGATAAGPAAVAAASAATAAAKTAFSVEQLLLKVAAAIEHEQAAAAKETEAQRQMAAAARRVVLAARKEAAAAFSESLAAASAAGVPQNEEEKAGLANADAAAEAAAGKCVAAAHPGAPERGADRAATTAEAAAAERRAAALEREDAERERDATEKEVAAAAAEREKAILQRIRSEAAIPDAAVAERGAAARETILDWESIVRDLRTLDWLAVCMRRRRFQAGSLRLHKTAVSFSSPEKGDMRGPPESFALHPSTRSHHLIEELTLHANRSVALKLLASPLRRTSLSGYAFLAEHPALIPPRKLQAFLAARGIASDFSSSGASQRTLQQIQRSRGVAAAAAVESFLRDALPAAQVYVMGDRSSTPRSHFALHFEAYTRFSSPIRRYADLVVHRQLLYLLDMEDCEHRQQQEQETGDATAAVEQQQQHKQQQQEEHQQDHEHQQPEQRQREQQQQEKHNWRQQPEEEEHRQQQQPYESRPAAGAGENLAADVFRQAVQIPLLASQMKNTREQIFRAVDAGSPCSSSAKMSAISQERDRRLQSFAEVKSPAEAFGTPKELARLAQRFTAKQNASKELRTLCREQWAFSPNPCAVPASQRRNSSLRLAFHPPAAFFLFLLLQHYVALYLQVASVRPYLAVVTLLFGNNVNVFVPLLDGVKLIPFDTEASRSRVFAGICMPPCHQPIPLPQAFRHRGPVRDYSVRREEEVYVRWRNLDTEEETEQRLRELEPVPVYVLSSTRTPPDARVLLVSPFSPDFKATLNDEESAFSDFLAN